ncbi:MAG: ferritin family protein [Chloroflexota bacterium]
MTEQDETLKAARIAIQMEIDGKEFYLKAGRSSGNRLGQELFSSLAEAEDMHRQKFEEIYNTVRSKQGWPGVHYEPDGGRTLRTIFARAIGEFGSKIKAAATELDAVQTAMGMENKTYDFYKERAKQATYGAERGYYEAIAGEEKEHYLVLLDYYEYIKDPAAWFVQKEHPTLDGG